MLLYLIYGILHVAVCETDVASEMNTFGLTLLKHLPANENTMISPFSICTAVAMLNAGAAGDTKKQIDAAFGWSNSSDLPAQYKELLSKIEGKDSKLTLSSNNRLYVDNSFTPLESYSDELTTNFGADVEAVNFRVGDNSATVEKINKWVEDKTNNKIKNLFREISDATRAILINTIYFKASWVHEFDGAITKDAFYLDEKYAIKTDTMHLEKSLAYYQNNDIELVKLPYASEKSQISMVVIKPKTRAGLTSLENKIKYQFSEVSSWMSGTEYSLLDLSMPKFEFKAGIKDFKEILQTDFKILDVFDPTKADLSGISTSEDLFVSFIIHKSFISVNENGTEAAAATAIGIETTSVVVEKPKPQVVMINQPFMFLIYDETSKVVLFVGRMVHPDEAEDSKKYLESRFVSSSSKRIGGLTFLLALVAMGRLL